METFAVDFETYYDKEYSLKTMTVFEYCADPRFDAYLVSVYNPGFQFAGSPAEFDWNQLHGKHLISHNTGFDQLVFLRLRKKGIIPAHIRPLRWDCTADMAAYLHVPRNLADATRLLVGEAIDKTLRDEMKGRKWTELNAIEKEAMTDYVLTDAKGCYILWEKCSNLWPAWEQEVSRLNREAGFIGFRVDEPKLQAALDTIAVQKFEAEQHIPWDWSGKKTPLSREHIALACREADISCPTSLAKDDEECMAWEDKYAEKYPWIKAIRDWRRLNMLHTKLLTLARGMEGGRFSFATKYFGAHTGRFSGSERFNMQNLPQGDLFGVDLRSLFLADSDDEELAIIDLSQIEARLLLWFVRDRPMLDLIQQGVHIYEAHARKTMGYDGPIGSLKATDPARYKLAKARVLGLGYGCGPAKFKNVARTMAGLELTDEEAKNTVFQFREQNPLIVRCWRHLQNFLEKCCLDKSTAKVDMPSGRSLRYFKPCRMEKGKTSHGTRDKIWAQYVREEGHHSVYGGLLTENLIQALARDLFCQGWLRLAGAGYKVRLTAHDEYVISVPKGTDLRGAQEIIAAGEAWTEKLPVGTEAKLSPCYTK